MDIVSALAISAFYAITREIKRTVQEYVNNQKKMKKLSTCFQYTLEKQIKSDEEINTRIKALIKSFQLGNKQPEYAYIQIHPNKAKNLSDHTIKILRQSLTKIQNPNPYSYFSNICGDTFYYQLTKKNRLSININQCDIYQSALNKKTIDYTFPEYNQRSYFDQQYTINLAKKLAFFGMLKYNLEYKVLQFEPNILLSEYTRDMVFDKLHEAYMTYKEMLIWRLILCCLAFGVLYALNSDRLFNLLKSSKRFLLSLFGKKEVIEDKNIKTIASQRLKCSCGKSMNLLPPCHHLTCCRQCYQLNKRCKICGEVSAQGQVIYI